MKARTELTHGIRTGWDNHNPTVVRGGLTVNHSATVVGAAR